MDTNISFSTLYPNVTMDWTTSDPWILSNSTISSVEPNTTEYVYDYFLVYGLNQYNVAMHLDLETIDYIYGPIMTGIALLSSFLIVFTFMKPSMLSPTTILLTGIVICQSITLLTIYGNYIYVYFEYGTTNIYIHYPHCIGKFVVETTGYVFDDMAYMLVGSVAIQRILVVRFPFKSRMFLTNKVSCLVLLICFVVAFAYHVPDILYKGHFVTFKEYLDSVGRDVSDYYYYEYYEDYYYYYYDVINGTLEVEHGEDAYIQYCVNYSDYGYRFIRIAKPIVGLFPFIILSVSSFYLIMTLRNRGIGKEIHESKSNLQKIRNMTKSILLFLIVELTRKIFALFFNISGIITMVSFDVFKALGYDEMVWLVKVWEFTACVASIINFWVYIVASEQFRKEIKATLTCAAVCKKRIAAADKKHPAAQKAGSETAATKSTNVPSVYEKGK